MGGEIIAQAIDVRAAQPGGGGAEIELLGPAEQIAIRPGGLEQPAEIGRIGAGDADHMFGPFVERECDRDAAVGRDRAARPYRDGAEHADPGQILARLLDGAGAVGLAALQQEAPADEILVHILQPLQLDGADGGQAAGLHMVGDIERLRVGILDDIGRVEFGQGVAAFLQCRCEARRGRQNVRRHRRRARLEIDLTPRLVGQRTFDLDAAEMEQRASVERNLDLDRRTGRRVGQGIHQVGILEIAPRDLDGDACLVIAETLQHGVEPIDILAGADLQREGADRGLVVQGVQLRAGLQRRIEIAIAGRGEIDVIGLGIGGLPRGLGRGNPAQHQQGLQRPAFHKVRKITA